MWFGQVLVGGCGARNLRSDTSTPAKINRLNPETRKNEDEPMGSDRIWFVRPTDAETLRSRLV